MKKSYRIAALIFVIALLPFLSACNKDSKVSGNGKEGTKPVETSEKSQNAVYQMKLLSVEVPKGWKFVDKPDEADLAYIYKSEVEGAQSPAVNITYCDPEKEVIQ